MKLTMNWLRANATATSYDRGEEYEDAVRKLKKEGTTYTAKVDGSETYKVEIIESDNSIYTDCTCPYDYEGICKHIVAVGLNILSGNFKEEKPAEMPALPLTDATNETVNTATFYEKEFLKAKKKKQDEFIKLLFMQDANVCRQFLSYIRPPAPPLSSSTDITELSNEIAAKLMEIDTDDYFSDEDEEEHRGRGYDRGYYDYDDERETYDTDALEKEAFRLLETYNTKALQLLEKGQFLDSVRVLLAIYEAFFIVEDPELDEYTDFSYADTLDIFFNQATGNWIEKTIFKTIKKSDYDAIFKLILDRWQQFKRFHGKATSAPYEFLDEELFYFIVQKTQNEQMLLDLMTANKLHTINHYELTKKLCVALNNPDFLLERLNAYGMDSVELSKELMLQYINREDRQRFVAVAQQVYGKYEGQIQEFIAEQILPTDNLGFFKKIVSEAATRHQRLDLFHHWREQVTIQEQKAYIELQKANNQLFYIAIIADAKRFSDMLIFAEQNVERLTTTIFETAAQWVLNIYPNEVFPLYCERIVLYMGKNASGRDHYQRAVEKMKPLKTIKGKEQDIRIFAAELRKMYNRLPAFLDELKKGGF